MLDVDNHTPKAHIMFSKSYPFYSIYQVANFMPSPQLKQG